MQHSSFLRGAQILTLASLAARVLGFIYRIIIVRIIGTEGIGLYQMVFPLYTLILVITTAGIPIAISKMVSQEVAKGNQRRAQNVMVTATTLLVILGLASTFIFYQLSPWLSGKFFADPRAYWPFTATLPAIFFVAVSSAFRGYYQGLQDMVPPACAQVIEQIIRFFLGVIMGSYFLQWGVEYATLGLSLAMVGGEMAGFAVLLSMYSKRRLIVARPLQKIGGGLLLHELGLLSLPVTLTRLVSSIALSLQAALIPQMLLVYGFNIREAMDLYGQFSGVALALLTFPTVVTVSVSISLIPAISEAAAVNDRFQLRKRAHQAIRLTLLTGLPCTLIFYLLAPDLTSLLFASPEAAVPLRILAFGSLFLYLQQASSGLLQGLGRMGTLLVNTALGAAVNLTGIYLLTPIMAIKGVALAYVIGTIVAATLNILAIARFTYLTIDFRKLIASPLLATLSLYLVLSIFDGIIQGSGLVWSLLSLSARLLGGIFIFMIVLCLTGGLKKSDFRLIPLLNRLFR